MNNKIENWLPSGNCEACLDAEELLNDYEFSVNEQWTHDVGELCFLINSLQINLYQIRFIESMRFSYAADGDAIPPEVSVNVNQVFDSSIVEKRLLMDRINKKLSLLPVTSRYSLTDGESLHEVKVLGGIENDVKVSFVGFFTYEEAISQNKYKSFYLGVSIFVTQRDFGEILVDISDIQQHRCEVLVADGVLGRIFWPFLTGLDATSYALKDPLSNLVEVEISEK